ncbi:MAG: hypothetical protein J6K32_06595 [Clostridia bacterium]|nr:hypothetical protein [Clostridia bacterium]
MTRKITAWVLAGRLMKMKENEVFSFGLACDDGGDGAFFAEVQRAGFRGCDVFVFADGEGSAVTAHSMDWHTPGFILPGGSPADCGQQIALGMIANFLYKWIVESGAIFPGISEAMEELLTLLHEEEKTLDWHRATPARELFRSVVMEVDM